MLNKTKNYKIPGEAGFSASVYLYSKLSVCVFVTISSETILDRDLNPFELGGESLGTGFKARW